MNYSFCSSKAEIKFRREFDIVSAGSFLMETIQAQEGDKG
jgi:hypothetical protein